MKRAPERRDFSTAEQVPTRLPFWHEAALGRSPQFAHSTNSERRKRVTRLSSPRPRLLQGFEGERLKMFPRSLWALIDVDDDHPDRVSNSSPPEPAVTQPSLSQGVIRPAAPKDNRPWST